ncbi:MAG: alpha/beta hydrolase [Streptococcaceae bacterium]|jgi:non-heme chloroperoxidase|nr:alpha/beta hydrolase [Streptococcaceae bacterium]
MKFLTSDNLALQVTDYGGIGPSIIFVNGYSASEATWLLQIVAFQEAGFRVITYDHRNHGLSEKDSSGATLEKLARDLSELCNKLVSDQVILIGHSMGAAVILEDEKLFGQEKIKAVVTEDQAPYFEHTRNSQEQEKFITNFPHQHLTAGQLPDDLKRELGKKLLPFDFKNNRDLLSEIIGTDFRPILREEIVPHLFLAGEKSPIFPPDVTLAARDLNQNQHSKVHLFPNCGHIPHLESPTEFNALVLDFIK